VELVDYRQALPTAENEFVGARVGIMDQLHRASESADSRHTSGLPRLEFQRLPLSASLSR